MSKRPVLALSLVGVISFLAYAAASGQLGFSSNSSRKVIAPVVANEADIEAINKSAKDYAEAFNQGNAPGIAAMWTQNGECREATGETFIGKDAIEKAHAEFFKNNKGTSIDILVKSVRFPAKDMAVEEGIIRQSRSTKDLPSSTEYSAIHIREGGQWKLALSTESGAGQDRLEDIEWLLGDWTAKVKDKDVKFSFTRDPKKQHITGSFASTSSAGDKVNGSNRISLDPETGRLRSWSFEDDGSHTQAIWHCDGKAWILDQNGTLADGTPVSERIILQRVAPDVITWRTVDRLLGDNMLSDTTPMRLTRTK